MKFSLLFPTKNEVRLLGEVTSPGILSPSRTSFDPKGLYSAEIFGTVGSEDRYNLFGYIDLKIDLLHPAIFKDVMSLKSLYKEIASGKSYGKFDPKIKDIVPSNIEEGHTGISWLMEQLPKIKFHDNDSPERRDKIKFVQKHMGKYIHYLYVLPAGLREYKLEDNTKNEEHEVADLYRRVLNQATMLSNININLVDTASLDGLRYNLQLHVEKVYDYFISLLDGKDKFLLSSWTKRGMDFGIRSVISGIPLKVTSLKEVDDSINNTLMGLFLVLKATSPKVMFYLHNLIINHVIDPNSSTLRVYKDGRYIHKQISVKTVDKWFTLKGIEEILSEMYSDDFKNEPVLIDGYESVMVYENDKQVTIITDETVLPEDLKQIRPITYGELFYIAVLPFLDELYPVPTRFPIGDEGSIYISKLSLVNTMETKKVTIHVNGQEFKGDVWPIGTEWVNILSPNITRWSGLGSDNDGDKMSIHIPLEESSIEEVRTLMNSKDFYIKPTGDPFFDLSNTVNEQVVSYMTTDME